VAVKKIDDDEIAWGEFQLIGINTSFKGYTLCFHLNQLLEAEFIKLNDHRVLLKGKKSETLFQIYGWNDEAHKLQLLLFENKSGNDWLLPEAAGVDFILRIDGIKETSELLDDLKNCRKFRLLSVCPRLKLNR
jgi:hypothetical protein